MTTQAKIYKDPFLGWVGETRVKIGVTDEGKDRVLEFLTAKRHNKRVTTSARVWEICDATGSKTTAVFGDYATTAEDHGTLRASEKNITEAHEHALRVTQDQITTKAKAQY